MIMMFHSKVTEDTQDLTTNWQFFFIIIIIHRIWQGVNQHPLQSVSVNKSLLIGDILLSFGHAYAILNTPDALWWWWEYDKPTEWTGISIRKQIIISRACPFFHTLLGLGVWSHYSTTNRPEKRITWIRTFNYFHFNPESM